MSQRPHALYRFYDADNRLLYVGITADLGQRLTSHASGKPWWATTAHVRIEHHDSREAVLEAERRAIVDEKPLHNIVHNRATSRAVHPAIPTMLHAGQVLALALTDGRPLIGHVARADRHDAELDLLDDQAFTFTAGRQRFRYDDILTVRFGDIADGQVDVDPLLEFVEDWVGHELTEADRQTIQKRLDTPGYTGTLLDPPPPRESRQTLIRVPDGARRCPTENGSGTPGSAL